MGDVNLDSSFNWAPVRTGMEELRAFASQTTRGIQSDMAGMFSPARIISVAVIEQGIKAVVEYGAKVFDLARRFGVSTTAIQQFGNAAEKNGSSLEAMTIGFARLDLARSKALGGNQQMIDSFDRLGITVEDLENKKPEELMLMIGRSSMNAADMVKILGRNGTELRATLGGMAAGMIEVSEAIDPGHINSLKKADVAWKTFTEHAKIYFADFVAGFTDANSKMLATLKQTGDTLSDPRKLFTKAAWTPVQAPLPPEPTPAAQGGAGAAVTGAEDIDEAVSRVGGRAAGISKEISLQEKLSKLEADAAVRQRTDQEQLGRLMEERVTLTNEMLTAYGQIGGIEADETTKLKATIAVAEKNKEYEELSDKMQKEEAANTEKINKLRQDSVALAEKELSDSRERNKEIFLEGAGRKDLADRAKIEYGFDQKIADAQDAINKAEEKGFTEVANTNRALVTQLSLEKQNALAAHDKASAEEMAAKVAREKANVGAEKLNLADLKEQNVELQLKIAGLDQAAELTKNEYDFNLKINEALVTANDLWTQMAAAYRENNSALGDQLAIHAQLKQDEADELALAKQLTAQQIQQTQALKNQQSSMAYRGGQVGVDQFNRPVGKNDLTIGSLASSNLRIGGGAYTRAWYEAGQQDNTPLFQQLYQRYSAEEQLGRLTGKDTTGFLGRAYQSYVDNLYGQKQSAGATAAANKSIADELAYWTAIYQGRGAPANNPFTSTYGVAPYMPVTAPTTTTTAMQIAQLQQQQLSELQAISKKLTPVPGR